jgi:hypothetical protein
MMPLPLCLLPRANAWHLLSHHAPQRARGDGAPASFRRCCCHHVTHPPPPPAACSYEWWWEDEDFERVTQPLGHAVQRGCVPYNQIIPRVGSYVMETMDVSGGGQLAPLHRPPRPRAQENLPCPCLLPCPQQRAGGHGCGRPSHTKRGRPADSPAHHPPGSPPPRSPPPPPACLPAAPEPRGVPGPPDPNVAPGVQANLRHPAAASLQPADADGPGWVAVASLLHPLPQHETLMWAAAGRALRRGPLHGGNAAGKFLLARCAACGSAGGLGLGGGGGGAPARRPPRGDPPAPIPTPKPPPLPPGPPPPPPPGPGLYYGPVGCKYDQYRSSLTPRL